MTTIQERLATLGLAIPDIILPDACTDLEKWAVIACDQYIQDRAYWETAKAFAGTSPSTVNLILPELYLPEPDCQARIAGIHATMRAYLAESVFAPPKHCPIYIERSTPFHARRRGILLAADLERYGWAPPNDRLLIRATEDTVHERLPARVGIRRGALFELPHVLLLLDDDQDALLPALGALGEKRAPLYRTKLMAGAGDISGWTLESEAETEILVRGLEELAARAKTRYGVQEAVPFLFAVGDGNHSLASAKVIWEEYKAAHPGEDVRQNPLRWALVEIENLYDSGIGFEPIHRVFFGVKIEAMLDVLEKLPGFERKRVGSYDELTGIVGDHSAPKMRLGVFDGKENVMWLVESDAPGITTESLQPILDEFLKSQDPAVVSIDYIHGAVDLMRVATEREGTPAVGILLPPVRKNGFFETVARSGALPRKSFSMGEAAEKRFYLEGRKLVE
jgi:hypothetical protein